MLFTEVEVVSVERLSPTFVRVGLGGPELADFGVDGPRYDQRIKLVFPDPETGGITSTEGADDSWFATWMERPAAERGHMRTYTIRDVRGSGGRPPSSSTWCSTSRATSSARARPGPRRRRWGTASC